MDSGADPVHRTTSPSFTKYSNGGKLRCGGSWGKGARSLTAALTLRRYEIAPLAALVIRHVYVGKGYFSVLCTIEGPGD